MSTRVAMSVVLSSIPEEDGPDSTTTQSIPQKKRKSYRASCSHNKKDIKNRIDHQEEKPEADLVKTTWSQEHVLTMIDVDKDILEFSMMSYVQVQKKRNGDVTFKF
jgi:hypothetical protein